MVALDLSISETDPSSPRALTTFGAIAEYLMTCDHKRLGRLLISFSAIFALGAALEGALLGAERIDPTNSIVEADAVVQLFSVFRFGLLFAVAAPLMLGIALAVMPTQVGARSLAFARAALFGFYLWIFGVIVVGYSYVNNGGPSGGDFEMVDLFLVGFGLVLSGLLLISATVATTILTSRRAGMTLIEAPIFSWSVLVTSVSFVLTLPVALGALIYVAVDHTYERATFGGNYGINAWLGWAFGAPQIFIIGIPTLGVLAQIVATMAEDRQPSRAGMFVGIGLMSTSIIGGVTQSAHTVEFSGNVGETTKLLIPYLFFNALPMLGIVAILAVGLRSLKNEKGKLNAAFVSAFLGVGMVLTGMVGNAVQKITNLDLGDTVFEEAVLVYVCYGVVLSGLGAVAFFGQRIWGREMQATPVLGLGLIGFLATVLASLPYFVAGFAGQPSAVISDFEYSGPAWLWNSLVSAGHALIAIVVVAFTALAIKSFRTGRTTATTSADHYQVVND